MATPKTETGTSADAVFAAYPAQVRAAMKALRALVLDVGRGLGETGGVVETLKWGQPSYLPVSARVGTTVRMDMVSETPARVALYFHCQTTLVDSFRALYADVLRFEGNRAIVLDADEPLPKDALRHCVGMALTYHLAKRQASKRGHVRRAG